MKNIWVLGAVFCSVCCVACGGDGVESLGSGSAKADTFFDGYGVSSDGPISDEQWSALTPEQRIEILDRVEFLGEDEWTGMKRIDLASKLPKPIDLNEIFYAPYREYSIRIDSLMRESVDMDGDNLGHSTIGDTNIYLLNLFVRKEDKKIFGSTIGYLQVGCDMPDVDDDLRHFETEEDAIRDGCDLSDVSWQAHGMYDYDGWHLRCDEYLEWSGY